MTIITEPAPNVRGAHELAASCKEIGTVIAVTTLTDDELRAQAWQVQDICAALDEADRGEFASDEEVNRFFAKYDC